MKWSNGMTKDAATVRDSEGRAQKWHTYGDTRFRTDQGVEVRMYRRGQRCRFYAAGMTQVGPEHANVVPAICYAFSSGWYDLDATPMANLACRIECTVATATALGYGFNGADTLEEQREEV